LRGDRRSLGSADEVKFRQPASKKVAIEKGEVA